MYPEHPKDSLLRMEAMLRHGRRRIVSAHIAARLRARLPLIAGGILLISLVFLVLRALAWYFAIPAPGGIHVLIVAVVFVVSVCAHALVTGLRGAAIRPDQVAERLDSAQETHNRVATAIALLKSGDESPFARAAINDGWETLKRIRDKEPQVDRPAIPWKRLKLSLVSAIAFLVAGLFLTPKFSPPRNFDDPQVVAVTDLSSPFESPTPAKKDREEPEPVKVSEPAPDDLPEAQKKKITEAKPPQPQEPETSSRSEGKMGRHSSAESRSSQSAAKSSSAASGGGAKSKPGDDEPGKPKPKTRKENKPKIAKKPKAEEEQKQGGSISARGASGSNSSSTAQNEWASKIKAKADEGSDLQQEDEPDEEADPDKLRPGTQPNLKNRSSRISRELSLMTGSEPANKQNRGRGGPGGQKKSRGTATMIMGVPVPGFVRGRLLPGPTKSTQEEVEPSPRAGDYAAAVSDLPQANPEEDSQERFHPEATVADHARQYLIQYHAEHENRRTEDPAGSP